MFSWFRTLNESFAIKLYEDNFYYFVAFFQRKVTEEKNGHKFYCWLKLLISLLVKNSDHNR